MVKGTHLKALGTIGTLKRALARMRDPVVQDHFASSSKRRTTHFTLEWLFSCMNPSVFLHIAFLRKTLAAKVASVKTIGIHNNNIILMNVVGIKLTRAVCTPSVFVSERRGWPSG